MDTTFSQFLVHCFPGYHLKLTYRLVSLSACNIFRDRPPKIMVGETLHYVLKHVVYEFDKVIFNCLVGEGLSDSD